MDDASLADPPTPDASADAAPDRPSPPSAATVTVAPSEVLLELPATPNELRPSLAARDDDDDLAGAEPDGLDALDAPLVAPAPAVATPLDTLRAEALQHLRQEGAWRLAVRALGLLLGVLLAFRLAFDEGLPRLLLLALGGALGLVVVVLLLHHLNETRRQENLLAALTQLTNVAREHPTQASLVAPHLDAVLAALRANASVWPWSRPPDALARALTRAFPDDAPPADS